jgi:hypothetical protein
VTESIRVSQWVTHERLDDEVIAINLETGAYYALEGTAADCWDVTAAGAAVDDVVAMLLGRYDVDADTARADAARLLEELLEERLVVGDGDAAPAAANGSGAGPASSPPSASRRAYAAPEIQKYDDLEDLLLLDPIHEVDEAGWPVARAD